MLGADIIINPLEDDLEAVLRDNRIPNIDKVIDCAGLISTAEYSIKHAGKGATVMLFGLTGPDDEMNLKPFELFKKELTIKGSFVNPDTFERAVRILAAGIIKTEDIITKTEKLEDIQRVFETKEYARDGKVLIKCF